MSGSGTASEGRCLCGTVRYRVSGTLGPVRYCHCRMCQRASGSAFSANASVPVERFALLAGADSIREYEASPGAFRCFCGRCGSPVFARLAFDPAHIRIRLGGLDRPHGVEITAHVWTDSKSSWYEIGEALPQYGQGFG
ncbi:GFA family protein [Emcibacter sp. SYSU 3D8]|uniref:GFA family protein n=1 Tax=Emcibacter sp. SYSU 3D8 TaxID=3133969 RepID=UPI0031FE91CB